MKKLVIIALMLTGGLTFAQKISADIVIYDPQTTTELSDFATASLGAGDKAKAYDTTLGYWVEWNGSAWVEDPSGGDIEGISSSGTVAGSDVVLALGIYGDNDAGIQIDTDTNQIEVTANGGGSLISTGGDINLSGLNVNVKNLKVLDNDGVVLNNTANTFATTLINSEQTANYNLTIPVLTQNSTVALTSDIPTLIDDDTFATATATNVASAESIKAYVDANSGGDFTKVGTTVDNQIMIATGDGTIEGDANLEFDTASNTFKVINGVIEQESSAYGSWKKAMYYGDYENYNTTTDRDFWVGQSMTPSIKNHLFVQGNTTADSYIKRSATSDDILLGDGTTTSLAAISGDELQESSEILTSRDAALTDADGMNVSNATSDVTITIPLNATVAFPVGTLLAFQRNDTGNVIIDYESGVLGDATQTYALHEVIKLWKTDTDTWSVLSPNTDESAFLTTVTSSDITDDTIQAIDLESTNAATDNYVATYDSASGGFTWESQTVIGGDLSQSDIDTFAELDAIVADVTLINSNDLIPNIDTGTTIDMSGETLDNFTAASAATNFTMVNIAVGGEGAVLINGTTEPTVTGATKLPNTASWITGTDMILYVKDFNGIQKFYFIEF